MTSSHSQRELLQLHLLRASVEGKMVIYSSHVHKEFPASFDIETLVSFLHSAALQVAFFSRTTVSDVPFWKESRYVIWERTGNMAFEASCSALFSVLGINWLYEITQLKESFYSVFSVLDLSLSAFC